MTKYLHEIYDPIHKFIFFDSGERAVINSRPVQRLRHIHQLGMTNLLYPGANHTRFEHSLGVMELAGRAFDVITTNASSEIRDLFPQIDDERLRPYWRQVVRIAGLCHDLGHLPFSHMAETDILPPGIKHEHVTIEVIRSPELMALWETMKLVPEDIIKVAIGSKYDPELPSWERIMSDIIGGDAFGVDRMDYLLRDSYCTGLAYGTFDHLRLINTMKILSAGSPDGLGNLEPDLGVEHGGLRAAEALLLARYFMYSQVYFHRIRLVYEVHLGSYLKSVAGKDDFPMKQEDYFQLGNFLGWTDNQVLTDLFDAAVDDDASGHEDALRIAERQHFKVLYESNPSEDPRTASKIYNAVKEKIGSENVANSAKSDDPDVDFPVERTDSVDQAKIVSEVIRRIPRVAVEYVFVDKGFVKEANEVKEKIVAEDLRKGE